MTPNRREFSARLVGLLAAINEAGEPKADNFRLLCRTNQ